MQTELIPYSYEQSALTVSRIPHTQDYAISVYGCAPATLKRGVDFGMIRKKNGDAMTKNPTLFKSGAEKVAYASATRWRASWRTSSMAFSTSSSAATS